MSDEPERELSALEKLLMGLTPLPGRLEAPLKRGSECPQCGEGCLDYNGLLQLECPCCGFVSAEGAGCT